MATRRVVVSGLTLALVPGIARAGRYVVPPLPPALDRLRDLPLLTPDGQPTTLGAYLPAGLPAVVQFWASWCAPCLLELRHLGSIRRSIGAARLSIVAVNVDREADQGKIAPVIERLAPDFPELRRGREAYQAFGGGRYMELPRLFVFDATGRPARAFGHHDQDSDAEVSAAINRVLP